MAIIYSYPIASPEAQDLLVGTEMALQGGEDAPRTRTFTIGSIADLIRPYKVYTALLFQEYDNPPVATVLENTLVETLSYSRIQEGEYVITTTGTFPQDKTWAVINTPSYDGNGPFALQIGRISNTECNIYAYSLSSGVLQELGTNDDRVSIEIRVYN